MFPHGSSPVLFALLTTSALANLSVIFPLDLQIPPIAVAEKEYAFTFSLNTFSTQEIQSRYQLKEGPAWLALNTTTRTFYGTPLNQDLGQFQVELQASTGDATVIDLFTLTVVDNNPLSGNYEVLVRQLLQAGSFSVPSTLILNPSSTFQIVFGHTLFNGHTNDTHYYAKSAGNTPLPTWVSFDASTLSISGATPPLLSPQASPQVYSFMIAATQIPNYSQALLSFEIAVTNKILAFDPPFQTIHWSGTRFIHVPPLIDYLYCEGQHPPRKSIMSIAGFQPAWLELDTHDLSLSGSPPITVGGISFRVDVTDDQNNSAGVSVRLLTTTRLVGHQFESYLKPVECVRGQEVLHQINLSRTKQANQQYVADLGFAKPWLRFISSNMALTGLVPIDIAVEYFNISLTLLDDDDPIEMIHFQIEIMDNVGSVTPNVSRTGGSTSLAPSETGSAALSTPITTQKSYRELRLLILAITLPVFVVLITSIAVWLYMRRHRRNKDRANADIYENESDDVQNSSLSSGDQIGPEMLHSSANNMADRMNLSRNTRESLMNEQPQKASGQTPSSPVSMSSWGEILNDMEAPRGNPVSGENSTTSPTKETVSREERRRSSPGSQQSGGNDRHRSSLLIYAAAFRRQGRERESFQQAARRSSGLGLGHGMVLSPALGQLPILTPASEQYRRQSGIATAQLSRLSARNSSLGTRMQQPERFSPASDVVEMAVFSKGDSCCDMEAYPPTNHSHTSEWQLSTNRTPGTHGSDDGDWVTEVATVESSKHDLPQRQDEYMSAPSIENHENGEIMCNLEGKPRLVKAFVSGKSVESNRSEHSQARSLRFL